MQNTIEGGGVEMVAGEFFFKSELGEKNDREERKTEENCIKTWKRPLKCIFLGYKLQQLSSGGGVFRPLPAVGNGMGMATQLRLISCYACCGT